MASFFSAVGGLIWIKFRRLVQNDMSTAVIWSKSKPEVELIINNNNKQIYKVPCMPTEGCRGAIPIWWTFGRIQWHVIPEPPVTLQGAATGRIQWHVIPEPRITLQGAATW